MAPVKDQTAVKDRAARLVRSCATRPPRWCARWSADWAPRSACWSAAWSGSASATCRGECGQADTPER